MNTRDDALGIREGLDLFRYRADGGFCLFFGMLRKIGIFRVGHKTRLGEIGRDYVRASAKAAHFGNKLGEASRIKLSVVAHNGIDEDQCVLIRGLINKVLDCSDLTLTTEKTVTKQSAKLNIAKSINRNSK